MRASRHTLPTGRRAPPSVIQTWRRPFNLKKVPVFGMRGAPSNPWAGIWIGPSTSIPMARSASRDWARGHGMSEVATPGGWHADPLNRHQYRWWDGAEWTGNVSDSGVASVDAAGLGVQPGQGTEPGTAVPTPITRTEVDALLPQVQHPNDFGLPSRPVVESRTYASPMSYVGSTRRLIRWANGVGQSSPAVGALAWTLAIFALIVMWFVVLPVWYFVTVFLFGVFMIPYRLIRRSHRKQEHLQATQLATMQVMLQQQQQQLRQQQAMAPQTVNVGQQVAAAPASAMPSQPLAPPPQAPPSPPQLPSDSSQ